LIRLNDQLGKKTEYANTNEISMLNSNNNNNKNNNAIYANAHQVSGPRKSTNSIYANSTDVMN